MSRLQTSLVILASIAVLYFGQEVFIPLVLSMLLAMLLSGPVQKLEKWHVPRSAAVTACVLVAAGILFTIGWLVTVQILNLADNLESYRAEVVQKIKSVRGEGDGTLDKVEKFTRQIERAAAAPTSAPASTSQPTPPPTTMATAGEMVRKTFPQIFPTDPEAEKKLQLDQAARIASTQPVGTEERPFYVVARPPPDSRLVVLGNYLGKALSPLGTLGIVLIFVFFILLEREDLRDRIIRLVSNGQYTITTTAVDDGITRIAKYLRAQAIVNGTYGLCVAGGLCLIGLTLGGKKEVFPSFLIWGLMASLLRFVPYIGPWIAAVFPLTLSLGVYHGFSVFIAVVVLFVAIEILSNNIMEPMLYGATTGLSTMAILVAAVFWAWLWGPVGLLLSTPLTVCLMVLGRYAAPLRFLEVLLGDKPAMTPAERVYQRLLAGDEDEALNIADDYAKENGLLPVYDDVLLCALGMSERDSAQGLLNDERETEVRSGMRRMIESLGQKEIDQRKATAVKALEATGIAPGPPIPTADATVRIVMLPAHDEADELAGLMLSQLLQLEGLEAKSVSHNALAGEMMELVTTFDPHVVCISATPPAAVSHVRYLMRRLAGKIPPERLSIGIWNAETDAEALKKRLDMSQASVSVKLKEAVKAIKQLTEMDRHIVATAKPA